MAAFGKLAFTLLLTFFSMMWVAFVLNKLYGYFIIPLGAPVLSYWHIYGIAAFFRALSGFSFDYRKEKIYEKLAESGNIKAETWYSNVATFVIYLLVWGSGAFVHWMAFH